MSAEAKLATVLALILGAVLGFAFRGPTPPPRYEFHTAGATVAAYVIRGDRLTGEASWTMLAPNRVPIWQHIYNSETERAMLDEIERSITNAPPRR